MNKKIFVGIVLLIFFVQIVSALPAFPGAEGFGSETIAGRGGTIYKVTTLANSGSGSLRECIDATGPRICIFGVSGTIQIDGSITISNPYITIAGQTAPSPGIQIRGCTLYIGTHDVLIQHIRFRVGDEGGITPDSRDAINIKEASCYNVVIDHCSISWAIDGNLDLKANNHDITVSHCIVSEGLHDSLHPKGPHSTGGFIAQGNTNISYIANLWAHNRARHPLVSGSGSTTLFSNHIIYNAKYPWLDLTEVDPPLDGPQVMSVVGCMSISGPETSNRKYVVEVSSPQCQNGVEIYIDDNDAEYSGWNAVSDQTGTATQLTSPKIWWDGLTVKPTANNEALNWVLNNAGAWPAFRDSVDSRIINNVKNETGNYLNSQNEVGGWPVLAENFRALTLPANYNGDDDGDGYTNLEELLHNFSAVVEGRAVEPPEPPPPEPIPGDLNNDTKVDIADLIIVAKNFGLTAGYEEVADTDSNNVIDIFDIVFVASRFT